MSVTFGVLIDAISSYTRNQYGGSSIAVSLVMNVLQWLVSLVGIFLFLAAIEATDQV